MSYFRWRAPELRTPDGRNPHQPCGSRSLTQIRPRGATEMIVRREAATKLTSNAVTVPGRSKAQVLPLVTKPREPSRVCMCSSSYLREANQHCNVLFLCCRSSQSRKLNFYLHIPMLVRFNPGSPSTSFPSLLLCPLRQPPPTPESLRERGLVSLPWNPITVGCCKINVHSHEIML